LVICSQPRHVNLIWFVEACHGLFAYGTANQVSFYL
jgi:hypothetical protein